MNGEIDILSEIETNRLETIKKMKLEELDRIITDRDAPTDARILALREMVVVITTAEERSE